MNDWVTWLAGEVRWRAIDSRKVWPSTSLSQVWAIAYTLWQRRQWERMWRCPTESPFSRDFSWTHSAATVRRPWLLTSVRQTSTTTRHSLRFDTASYSFKLAFQHFTHSLSFTPSVADRAKQIQNFAKINTDSTEKIIRDLKEENEKLKKLLERESPNSASPTEYYGNWGLS